MPSSPRPFTSVDQFTLDEGQALAAISEMTNLHAFLPDLRDAEDWVQRGNKPTDLVNLLAFEGISNFTVSEIVNPSGIGFIISLIDFVASSYLNAVADLMNCDVQSALSYLIEWFDGPPLSLGDKVTIAIGGVGLALAAISPIPGDETAIAGYLAAAGILVSGVDILFTAGDYFFGEEDSSTFMFLVSILTSGLPILPGLGQIGFSASKAAIATEASDAIISSVLINRLKKLEGLYGLNKVPLLTLIDHEDVVADLAAAWGVSNEIARGRLQQAAAQAQGLQDLINSMNIPVSSSGPGILTLPNLPKTDHSDRNRLVQWFIHHGVDDVEARNMAGGGLTFAEWQDFWDRHPGLNESIPPDLSNYISELP